MISGVVPFRFNNPEQIVRLKKVAGGRTPLRVLSVMSTSTALRFRRADRTSEVTDEDEKVRQL
jgi:hypothetical protein